MIHDIGYPFSSNFLARQAGESMLPRTFEMNDAGIPDCFKAEALGSKRYRTYKELREKYDRVLKNEIGNYGATAT